MEHKLAEELYSDSLHLSNSEHFPASTVKASNVDDVWEEDGSLRDDSEERLDSSTDLNREWQRRRQQFITIGYGDGLIAGKEDSLPKKVLTMVTRCRFIIEPSKNV